MPIVGIRDLSRRASAIVRDVRKTGEPAVVTDHGRPVGVIYPLDAEALEDFILGHAAEFVEGMARADEELAAGETSALSSVLAEIRAGQKQARPSNKPGSGTARRRAR